MKKYFKYLLSCYLLLAADYSFSQNKIDSIFSLLKTDKADTNKVNHLNSLAREFRNNNPDTAIYFTKLALALSEKNKFKKGIAESYLWRGTALTSLGKYDEALPCLYKALAVAKEVDNKIIIAKAYNNIGQVLWYQGNYQEALIMHNASLQIKKMMGDKMGVGNSFDNIGNIYSQLGNYPDALKNYFAGLKIRESIHDQEGIATSKFNIGLVYYRQDNYSDALNNYREVLKIREIIEDKKGIADCYNNIALVYGAQGNYEKALENLLISMEKYQVIGNEQGIAETYSNLGWVNEQQGNFARIKGDQTVSKNKYWEALKNHLAALEIREKIGDRSGIVISCNNIGSIYRKQMNYKKAETYLLKAEVLAKEIGLLENLRDTYILLTELDSAEGNYKGAYENHKLFIQCRDSLDNEQTRKKTIQTQMTYDFEKKEAVANAEHKKELENQEALADEKSRKQNIVILFVVCGLLLVAVFAGFIFRSLRITRKQKILIESQKTLVEEKQREILDSIHYAKRIQQSLFPTEKYIAKNLDRLNKS